MKIIFLDIDGVLNGRFTADRIDGFLGLDPKHIATLNTITDAVPDTSIVISSTWRKSRCSEFTDFNGLVKLLHSRGVKAPIIGMTPVGVKGYRYNFVPRGREISAWLNENGQNVDSFVVLDDDNDGMEPAPEEEFKKWHDEQWDSRDLRPNHIYTDMDFGLLPSHAKRAIRVLRGEVLSKAEILDQYPSFYGP